MVFKITANVGNMKSWLINFFEQLMDAYKVDLEDKVSKGAPTNAFSKNVVRFSIIYLNLFYSQ